MKKVVFCIIPLVVVLMGCASSGGSVSALAGGGGGSANGTAQAAKLAKDLNAIKAGSAKASGGTVTLSDWVGLKTALTVPEGVTLDLTAEGAALELQDGAVLTVNGTVRTTGHGDHGKGWVEGSLRVGDGAAVINGSGTINLTSKGRLLNIGSDKAKRQLTLDGVTLVGLPDNDSPLVGMHENSALILKSGAITGNTHSSDEWAGGGGVEVYKGTFTMEGGAISGNTAVSTSANATGGGVHLEGTFTMSGGAISGNSITGGRGAIGGGVNVGSGTFTMTGGEISSNSATGKNWSHGGGVCADKGSSFIMQGGTISANTAAPGGDGGGGGVKVMNGSAFIMEGGTIYGKAGSLPAGTDARLANSAQDGTSLYMDGGGARNTAKWGIGGTYTKGGVSQTGGSNIGTTDDTLIAAP